MLNLDAHLIAWKRGILEKFDAWLVFFHVWSKSHLCRDLFGRNHNSAIFSKMHEIEHVHMLFGRSFGRLKTRNLGKIWRVACNSFSVQTPTMLCYSKLTKNTEFVFINCSTFSYWHTRESERSRWAADRFYFTAISICLIEYMFYVTDIIFINFLKYTTLIIIHAWMDALHDIVWSYLTISYDHIYSSTRWVSDRYIIYWYYVHFYRARDAWCVGFHFSRISFSSRPTYINANGCTA